MDDGYLTQDAVFKQVVVESRGILETLASEFEMVYNDYKQAQ